MNQLSHRSSKEIVDKLRELRLDKFVGLPAIIVGGDTSAGKSSLLTAISGLQFPTKSCLTTRCPTEVILQQSDVKHALVTLQKFEGMTVEQSKFRRELKDDFSDFESAIEQATQILTFGKGESYISPNAIVIRASGPELCDLTLIDLPGLVSACAKNESDEIIGDIRSMIQGYMQSSRTVILCVVPANNDFHNSAILTMAKDPSCDSSGVRTLGIITKPDLVDKGAEDDVVQLATNQRATLKLGWHVVRLRSQRDVQCTTLSDAESEEKRFFDGTIWNGLDKDAVGVPKLRERLQGMLLKRVKDELPAVLDEATKRLNEIENCLRGFGQPCDSPQQRRCAYTTVVSQCAALLDASLSGRYTDDFFQSAAKHSNNFRARQFELERRFMTSVIRTRSMCIGEYEVGDYVTVQGDRCRVLGVLASEVGVHRETQDEDDMEWFAFEDVQPCRKALLQILQASRGDHLPGFESYEVFKVLVKDKLKDWSVPSDSLRNDTVKLMGEMLIKIVDYVTPVSLPSLRKYLMDRCNEIVDRSADRLTASMQEHLRVERERPYSQNHYYQDILIKLRNKGLKELLEAKADRAGNIKSEVMQDLLSSWGIGNQSMEEAAAIELEFRLAAYLKVATKRIVDHMPQLLNTTFVVPILSDVQRLQIQLTDEDLESIMAEDPSVTQKRAESEEAAKALREGIRFLKEHFRSADC